MKIINASLLLLITLNTTLHCQIQGIKWNKFVCSNQNKCQGLEFSIKYPNSWTIEEGERPHIVQKFGKEISNGYIELDIYLNKFERIPTKEEVNQILSYENIKQAFEFPSTIEYNKDYSIDGIKCVNAIYLSKGRVYDRDIKSIATINVLVWEDYLVQFNFMVSSDDQKYDTMFKIVEEYDDLFTEIIVSIVILSQWK